MASMDARRLVRALGVTLLLALVVGGGVGFAMASAGAEALAVPAPRPGDRAVYNVTQVVVDADRLVGGDDPVGLRKVAFEWLPATVAYDRDFRPRAAHTLRATYTLDAGPLVQEIVYDAATGEALYRSRAVDWSWSSGTLLGVNGNGPFWARVTDHARADDYLGQISPCGMVHPLQGAGARDGPGDLLVQGACDWPGGAPALTYEPAGWQDTSAGRGFAYEAPGTPLALWLDGRSPFPVRVLQPLGDFLQDQYTQGRLWDLQRVEVAHGLEPYAATPRLDTLPDRPVLLPRTPWILDDAGLALALPLSEAHAAALAQPVPTPGSTATQADASSWLQAHPGGYLAYALRLEHTDRYGDVIPSWLLFWVDGDAWLGKQVADEPVTAPVVGLNVPVATGRRVTVQDWIPDWLPDDVSAAFPAAQALPATAPSPAALMQRYRAMSGPDVLANRYGFAVGCASTCDEANVVVEAGSHRQDRWDVVNNYERGLETSSYTVDRLVVDGDGRLRERTAFMESEQGTFSLEGAPAGPPGPGTGGTASSSAWVLPSAPVAATGIGLLALLGGAVYYFWPVLKGGVLGGLFSRTMDDRLLQHPRRAQLMQLVEAQPGVHFQDLLRQLRMGRGNLEHHLRKMLAAGLLTKVQHGGYACFFPKGAVDHRVMQAAPLLRSPGGKAVFDAVRANPGRSGRDLAVQLGLAPSTVAYHLKKLAEAGLVVGTEAGARLSPLGEQAAAAA